MVLKTTRASLSFFKPGNNTVDPDLYISSESGDFNGISLRERIHDRVDSTKITLQNDRGQYTDKIDHGDKVVFRVADEINAEGYSRGPYGNGAYGKIKERWTGVVGPSRNLVSHGGGQYTLEFDCEDFVFWVLKNRLMYESYENESVAGSEDAIVNELLTKYAPEIDQRFVEPAGKVTDYEKHGENLLDAFVDLTERSDATMYSTQENLAFKRLDEIEPAFELQYDDFYRLDKTEDAGEMFNDIRIDAAEDKAPDPLGFQDTVDGYQRVTDSNRITHRIQIGQSRIERMEVWTRKDQDSDDSLVVRMQPDVGGAPSNPDNRQRDIDRRQLAPDFISHDHYTGFVLSKKQYGDRRPWMIIEASGEDGHEIGIRSSDGVPAYQAHYPYPISVREEDRESIDRYRRMQSQVRDKSLTTFRAARDTAEQKINHYAQPEGTVEFEAKSRRAHGLNIGDVITLNFPTVNAVGDYIIAERQDEFDGVNLHTSFQAKDTEAF